MLITDFFDKFEYILITEPFTENNDSQQRDLSIFCILTGSHCIGMACTADQSAGPDILPDILFFILYTPIFKECLHKSVHGRNQYICSIYSRIYQYKAMYS